MGWSCCKAFVFFFFFPFVFLAHFSPISEEPDSLHVLSHSFFSVWNFRWVWKSINQTIERVSPIWESVSVCCSERAIRFGDLKRRCNKRAIRSLRSVAVTVAVHLRSHPQPSPDAASPIWSYPVSDLKVGIFPPFLVSYSITVSRVLKITLECRFIDDFSQTEIDLVLKTRNIYVLLVLMKFYILKF